MQVFKHLFPKNLHFLQKKPPENPVAVPDARVRFTKQSRKYGIKISRYILKSVTDTIFLGLPRFCSVSISPKLLLRNARNILNGCEGKPILC